jgi:hypothetical protein
MKTTMRHLVIGLGFCICVGMLPVSGVAQVLYGSYTYSGAGHLEAIALRSNVGLSQHLSRRLHNH